MGGGASLNTLDTPDALGSSVSNSRLPLIREKGKVSSIRSCFLKNSANISLPGQPVPQEVGAGQFCSRDLDATKAGVKGNVVPGSNVVCCKNY